MLNKPNLKSRWSIPVLLVFGAIAIFSSNKSFASNNDTVWMDIMPLFRNDFGQSCALGEKSIMAIPVYVPGNNNYSDTTYIEFPYVWDFESFQLPAYIDVPVNMDENRPSSAEPMLVRSNNMYEFRFAGQSQLGARLKVFDAMGRKLKDKQISANSHAFSLPDNNLYILYLQQENQTFTWKVMHYPAGSNSGRTSYIKSTTAKNDNPIYKFKFYHRDHAVYTLVEEFDTRKTGHWIESNFHVKDTVWRRGSLYGTSPNPGYYEFEHLDSVFFRAWDHWGGDVLPGGIYEVDTVIDSISYFRLPVSIDLPGGNPITVFDSILYRVNAYTAGQKASHTEKIFKASYMQREKEIKFPTYQFQYLGGQIMDEHMNPVNGAVARIKNDSTHMLIKDTITDQNGMYFIDTLIHSFSEAEFHIGGMDDKYSYSGDVFTIPEILDIDDTINTVFNYVLYDKDRPVPNYGILINPPASHINQWSNQNIEIAFRPIKFYLGPEWSYTEKNIIRQQLDQLENMLGIPNMYTEVDEKLNLMQYVSQYHPIDNPTHVGVNIMKGDENTGNHYGDYFESPLGHQVYGYFYGEVELSGAGPSDILKYTLWHEVGHAYSFSHVGYDPSIMMFCQSGMTNEDRVIWRMKYLHSKFYFDPDHGFNVYYRLYRLCDELPE